MNEQDDPNRSQLDVLQEEAWAALADSEREHLQGLLNELDESGEHIWEQWLDSDPEDPEFVLLVVRQTDEWDPRIELVGRWLVKAMIVPLAWAQTIVAEHTSDH
jgi:hypothetical protein